MCWKSSSLGQPGCGMAQAAIFLCTAGIFIVPALPSPGALQPAGLIFLGTGHCEACRDWDPSPQPIRDIHLSHDYTLLHCISKSPLFCREHMILLSDFCIGQGFSSIFLAFVGGSPMMSQQLTQCHNAFSETSVTSVKNSGWERKVNTENYHVNNLHFCLFGVFSLVCSQFEQGVIWRLNDAKKDCNIKYLFRDFQIMNF